MSNLDPVREKLRALVKKQSKLAKRRAKSELQEDANRLCKAIENITKDLHLMGEIWAKISIPPKHVEGPHEKLAKELLHGPVLLLDCETPLQYNGLEFFRVGSDDVKLQDPNSIAVDVQKIEIPDHDGSDLHCLMKTVGEIAQRPFRVSSLFSEDDWLDKRGYIHNEEGCYVTFPPVLLLKLHEYTVWTAPN